MFNMRKKGQIQSNVIMYALFMIVAAMILLFGYSMIKTFREKAEEADMARFRMELGKSVRLSTGYGDVNEFRSDVPSSVKEICFYDYRLDKDESGLDRPVSHGLESKHSFIANSVEDGVKSNVFFIGSGGMIGSDFVDKLSIVPPHYICKKVKGGGVKIYMEGKGDSAQIGKLMVKQHIAGSGTINIEDVDGLSLEVPSGYTGEITFGVKTETDDARISDSIVIEPSGLSLGSNPFLLRMPLPEGEDCTNLEFKAFIDSAWKIFEGNCDESGEGIVIFEIDRT